MERLLLLYEVELDQFSTTNRDNHQIMFQSVTFSYNCSSEFASDSFHVPHFVLLLHVAPTK